MNNRYSIADISKLVSSGGTPSRKHPEYFTMDDQTGHLWVKSKELLDCAITTTEERITDEGLKNSSAKYYPAGTVLVAMYGANVGQLGWLRNPATVNQAVCGIVVDSTVADFRLVFYTLLLTRSTLAAKAQGAAQQNLNQDLIRSFPIALPSFADQRRVASILSAYDDLIENNTRRITILENMAQMVYREWFVNFRFPGHGKVKMVDSKIGQIPVGWTVGSLGSVAGVNERSIKPESAPDEICYIDISSVSTASVNKKERMGFDEAPGRARRIVQHGDIIWSTVRPNRRSYALILRPEPNQIVSTGFAVLTARSVPLAIFISSPQRTILQITSRTTPRVPRIPP